MNRHFSQTILSVSFIAVMGVISFGQEAIQRAKQPAAAPGTASDNEAMPVPIETALPPPAPGEKRDPPSLAHADPILRRNAIHAIKIRGSFGDPIPLKGAVAELMPALEDSDVGVREAAASALGALGRLAKPALPAMIANLKDAEFRVRYFTAVALRNMRADAKDAVPALLEALQDPHAGVRVEAAEALIRIDESQKESVAPTLKAVLEDKSQKTWIHVRAAQVLAVVDPDELKPFASLLAAAMNHADARLRVRAAAAFGQIGDSEAERAVTLLLDLMAKGPGNLPPQPNGAPSGPSSPIDWQTAQEASQALVTIGPRALPALQSAFKTGSDFIRQQVVGYAGSMGTAAMPLLTDALKDSNPNIRQQAMWSLAALGPQAKPALPAIREALRNPPKSAEPKPNSPVDGPLSTQRIDPRVMEVQLLTQIDPGGWILEATKLLKDQSPQVRQQVLSMLMFQGVKSPEAQQVVMESLRSDDKVRRSQAMAALAPLGLGKDAIPAVATALKDVEPYARANGFLFLSQFGPDAKAAVPMLVEALGKPEMRFAAAETLAKIDPNAAKSIVPTLLEQLSSEKPGIRALAARILLVVDPSQAEKSLPILIEVLKSLPPNQAYGPAPTGPTDPAGDAPPDPVSTALALGPVGPIAKDAAPFVLALARHPNVFSFSRMGLAEAAVKLDPSLANEAATLLSEIVYESSNPFLKADAAGPLVRIDPSQSEKAIPVLLDILDHVRDQGMGMEQKLGSRVISGLAAMGSADAVSALTALQMGSNPQLAKLAADALARMQSANTTTVTATTKSMASPDDKPSVSTPTTLTKTSAEPPPNPDPKRAREFREQADAHLRRGKLNEAIAAMQEAIRFEPQNSAFQYLLAFMQHRAGRVEEAQQTVQIAKDLEQNRRLSNWGQLMENYQGPSRVWLENARQ